jgi:hypothetical protein
MQWTLEVPKELQPIDREEVARAARLLFTPGGRHAIQALRSGRWETVESDDIPAILAGVERLGGEQGVFYSLNPIVPGFARPSKGAWNNGDIERRQLILVDVDSGQPRDENATGDEKSAAFEVAGRIRDYLMGLGWPPPIVIDSGNGWHLLWRVDLPNDKLTQQVVSRFLKALAAMFDMPGGAHVDTSVHDARRIARLPGCMNRKGADAAERPQRPCKLVSAPAERPTVSYEAIAAVAGVGAEPVGLAPAHAGAPAARGETIADDPGKWTIQAGAERDGGARAALEGEVGKLLMTTEHRHTALFTAALKLGNFVASGDLTEQEVRSSLDRAARAIGLPDPGIPDDIERQVSNGLQRGIANGPRANRWEDGRKPEGGAATPGLAIATVPAIVVPKRLTRAAKSITPKEVQWLWRHRIPRGKVSLAAGPGGLGKSFVLMDLAARISDGGEVPLGNGECFDPGRVLLVNAEDDPEDTIVPRLIEAGANLDRIFLPEFDAFESWTLANIDELARATAEFDGADLIVIDPAPAYIGKVDDHRNAELQVLMRGLRRFAMNTGTAVVLVSHVNKGSGDAASRVNGGVAWVNSARAGMLFQRDKDDPEKRLLLPIKSNNGPTAPGLRYSIESTETLARIVWEGEADVTADEAVAAAPTKRNKPTDADIEAWLRSLFRATLVVPSQSDVAYAMGISEKRLKAARDRLKITPRQIEGTGGRGWEWRGHPDLMTGPASPNAIRRSDDQPI